MKPYTNMCGFFLFSIGRWELDVRRSFCLLYALFFIVCTGAAKAGDLPHGVPDPDILEIVFSGEEHLQYNISWSGGIKIGELSLQIRKESSGRYAIHARVTDYGVFGLFYPVDDTFVTLVRGSLKLPYRYEVLQKEGWGSVTRRLTRYDQQGLQVHYKKNDEAELLVQVDGQVHNEFSSFYATRAMDLTPETAFMVPTFADKKRNEVMVQVKAAEIVESVLGEVKTVQVMPIMKFKGLYDKEGDTVIWFTDDACRVPVKINSKILIGSLTARLVSYRNPACSIY